jgi:hypothetical protein
MFRQFLPNKNKITTVFRVSRFGNLRACLDAIQIPNFFTLSITSIFNRLHGVLNVGKKIINYTV